MLLKAAMLAYDLSGFFLGSTRLDTLSYYP